MITTYETIVAILKEAADSKIDITVPANSGLFAENGDMLVVEKGKVSVRLMLSDIALQQLSKRLNIPLAYARRLYSRKDKTLFDSNFNTWLRLFDKELLIRTSMGPKERIIDAVLSDKYRIFDNNEFFLTAINAIELENVEKTALYMVNGIMYCYIISKVSRTVKMGDDILGGVLLRNSETRFASTDVIPIFYRQEDDSVYAFDSLRTVHLGKADRKAEYSHIQSRIHLGTKNAINKINVFVGMAKNKYVVSREIGEERVNEVFKEIKSLPCDKEATPFQIANAISNLKISKPSVESTIKLQMIAGKLLSDLYQI